MDRGREADTPFEALDAAAAGARHFADRLRLVPLRARSGRDEERGQKSRRAPPPPHAGGR